MIICQLIFLWWRKNPDFSNLLYILKLDIGVQLPPVKTGKARRRYQKPTVPSVSVCVCVSSVCMWIIQEKFQL